MNVGHFLFLLCTPQDYLLKHIKSHAAKVKNSSINSSRRETTTMEVVEMVEEVEYLGANCEIGLHSTTDLQVEYFKI